MKNFESFSVLCWANRAKADVNGLLPVYARVTVMGKRAEISLKKKVSPEKWDAKSGFMTGNSNETRLFNKHLISVNNDLHAIYMDFKQRGLHLTAEEVKNKYLGIEAIRRSLLEVFDEHNKNVEELVGKDFVKGTHTKYETIRTKVAEFIAYKYKKQDLYLDTLEYSFITAAIT
jgi:hypothetical protein